MTEAIKAVDEASSNVLESLMKLRRAPPVVCRRTSTVRNWGDVTLQGSTYLVSPRSLDNLPNPIGEIGLLLGKTAAGVGKANRLKDPKHSSGSPAITCPPKIVVLVRTEFDVLPQQSRRVLEIIAV